MITADPRIGLSLTRCPPDSRIVNLAEVFALGEKSRALFDHIEYFSLLLVHLFHNRWFGALLTAI